MSPQVSNKQINTSTDEETSGFVSQEQIEPVKSYQYEVRNS